MFAASSEETEMTQNSGGNAIKGEKLNDMLKKYPEVFQEGLEHSKQEKPKWWSMGKQVRSIANPDQYLIRSKAKLKRNF